MYTIWNSISLWRCRPHTVFFLIDRLDDMSMIVATRRLLDAEISVFEAFPQSVANKAPSSKWTIDSFCSFISTPIFRRLFGRLSC